MKSQKVIDRILLGFSFVLLVLTGCGGITAGKLPVNDLIA